VEHYLVNGGFKPFSSTDRLVKHITELGKSLQSHQRAILLTCFIYDNPGFEIIEKSTNYEEVRAAVDKNITLGVEMWQANADFYKILKDKFKDETNFILINDSAENLKEYLNSYNIDKVDYIISGLPFASLPDAMSKRILSNTKEILKVKGQFITFQYTLFKMKLFRIYFGKIKRKKVLLNLPPAYVLKCKN